MFLGTSNSSTVQPVFAIERSVMYRCAGGLIVRQTGVADLALVSSLALHHTALLSMVCEDNGVCQLNVVLRAGRGQQGCMPSSRMPSPRASQRSHGRLRRHSSSAAFLTSSSILTSLPVRPYSHLPLHLLHSVLCLCSGITGQPFALKFDVYRGDVYRGSVVSTLYVLVQRNSSGFSSTSSSLSCCSLCTE